MVCLYGLSQAIGLARLGQRPDTSPGPPDDAVRRDCSEPTARGVDEEARRLLTEAAADAGQALSGRREQLDPVAGGLLRRETVDARDPDALLRREGAAPPPAGGPRGATVPAGDLSGEAGWVNLTNIKILQWVIHCRRRPAAPPWDENG